MNKIIESCNYLLNNCPQAEASKNYLDGRLMPETQQIFQFGYFPNSQNLSTLTDILSEEELKENKLLYSKNIEDNHSFRKAYHCYFEDYPLIMPYHNVYGDIVGIVGRTLLSENERAEKKIPKYKNTQDSQIFKKGNLLFGLYQNKKAILENDCVYIVEGQFDLIKAYEIGFRNIVALGNNNLTYYQFSLILRYTTNIKILLDNDDGGYKGRERIYKKFNKFANINNCFIPEPYKDLYEYIDQAKITEARQLRLF